jgi:two-component sensor histidine kinase
MDAEAGAEILGRAGGQEPGGASPGDRRKSAWRFPSARASVPEVRRALTPFLLPRGQVDDLILAACEAATNAVEHASRPTSPVFDVRAEIDGESVLIEVSDHGRWKTRQPAGGNAGHGLQLMMALVSMSLVSGPRGTTVSLRSP